MKTVIFLLILISVGGIVLGIIQYRHGWRAPIEPPHIDDTNDYLEPPYHGL